MSVRHETNELTLNKREERDTMLKNADMHSLVPTFDLENEKFSNYAIYCLRVSNGSDSTFITSFPSWFCW